MRRRLGLPYYSCDVMHVSHQIFQMTCSYQIEKYFNHGMATLIGIGNGRKLHPWNFYMTIRRPAAPATATPCFIQHHCYLGRQNVITLLLGCHHVRVFSDPPKSVSELVTYGPSTLSSRSDFGIFGFFGKFWLFFFGFFGKFWIFVNSMDIFRSRNIGGTMVHIGY
jgi:hypothetical protein